MAEKNPFDVELPKKKSNPFDVDIDIEKKNLIQPVPTTGTKPSKTGFETFQSQVDTSAPSVILSDEQKLRQEQKNIGERFKSTLLKTPTKFGKVANFMDAAKKVKDTLPQTPEFRKVGEIPKMQPTEMTEGQRLGESLTKGTDVRELITDKLTGKKTGLQKQIEAAQDAFRQSQGGELVGEIQGAQQLKNMYPESVETERERKGNYTKFLYNQFLSGTGSAASGLIDFALAIDKSSLSASPISKSGFILDYYRKNNAKGVRNFLKDNIGFEVDKGLEAKYNEGMLTGAIGGLASSAPAMITAVPTMGGSLFAQMYDGALQSIEAQPDSDKWDNDTKTIYAGSLGLIQAGLEKYGLDKILKGGSGQLTDAVFRKILKSAEGRNITGHVLENLIDENVKGVARIFAKGGVRAVDAFATEFFTGSGQETAAIGSEIIFDKATGKPIFNTANKTDWIGFVERIAKAGTQEGIGGFVLGGGVGMLSGLSKKKVKESQAVINEIDRQLDNPNTQPEVVEVLLQRKADTQANIDDVVDLEADVQSKMSPDELTKSQELSKQIDKIDLALQDPNTGESLKADLESQKEALEKEIDEILKKVPDVPQPTFDTEESIGEEIRESNRKFQADEIDQAAWEQEQKDLNKRAENLIPVPEEAEIGKPEEVAIQEEGLQEPTGITTFGNEKIKPNIISEGPQKEQRINTEAIRNFKEKDTVERNNSSIQNWLDSIGRSYKKEEGNEGEELFRESVFDKESQSGVLLDDIYRKWQSLRAQTLNEPKVGESVGASRARTPLEQQRVGQQNRELAIIDKLRAQEVAQQDSEQGNISEDSRKKQIEAGRMVEEIFELSSLPNDPKKAPVARALRNLLSSSTQKEKQLIINEIKNKLYAISQSISSKVPVQPEAPVSKEVEQGKPEAKPKVVTEEGVKAEEVTPALSDVEITAKELEGKYGIILDLAENKNGDLSIGRIIVPKENRSKGIGKKAMQDIVDYADKNGRRILLTPSTDFGATSVARLKEFYKEFGFIENKGKNKDFTTKDSMYRNPQLKQEQTPAQEVEQLRADEQAELKSSLPKAEQYLTDGKVDRAKITDAKDLKKFDEIYDKYDRLITPLLPEKETSAPKEEAPAKAKAAPKLTSKVDTKLKIKALSDLDNKIKSEKGRAKKSKLEADKLRLIEKNPSIGYVYDNFKNVLDQLVEKGLISSDGKKVVYEGKPYATNDFASVLHDGLLDQMVQDGIVDDSKFTPMLKTVEKTDDQITREQTRETEMLLSGTAEKRRAEGKFVKDGVEYVRNPKNQGVVSSLGGKVKFTNDIFVPFKYKLVEAETLQPSHQNGRRNPLHFIPEAQPKNRNDEGSIQAEESFANKPRFGELGKADAYSGAPVVNERNEVVQGNNRSAGLKKGYDRNNQQYKNDLIDNAEEFGFSEEQVRSMKSPILVRQIASNDQGSIELGNYDVKDLETAGTRRIDPVATTRRMPFGAKGRLAELMFSGEDTLNKAIRKNQKRIIEIISPYLNQAQRSTIIKDGALTDIGVNDIEDIAKQFLFDNGDSSLPDLFDNLSATQKEGLRRALPYLFSVSPEKSLIQDIQVAIIATNDFLSSDTRSFDSWLGQGDMFNDGMTPKEKYTPLEIAIARLLVEEKSQKGISNVFLDYAKAVADKAADMFGPETKGKSRKEGVLEIFKVEDNEKPDSTGGGEAVGAEQEIEGQETERKGINIRATPSVQKKELEVKIKALSDIEAAKEKLKEASAALSKLNKNLGIYADPEQQAKALFEYHKALVGVAKAYINAGVTSVKDFAREMGESLTDEIKDAWKEAKGISKKTLSDFKAEVDTSLVNEEVKLKRDIYGFDEPLLRETKPNPELLEEAIQKIKDGESVYDIIAKVNNGEPLTDVETVMLAQFQGTKEAELYKVNKKIEQLKDSSPLEFDKTIQKRAEIIDDLIASYDASELSGTVTGRALQARKVRVLQDYSLANMLIRVRKANNNRNLTNEQINEVSDKYNELIEAEAKLKAKVEQLTKENEKLKLAKSEAKLRREAASDVRNRNRAEVKEALKKERSSIIEEMKKVLNKGRNQLSMNPIPVEMLPLVGKLAKNYFLDGKTSIEAIVDNVYEDLKDLVDGVTKRDVRDAISGYGRDTRPTQNDLQRELFDLREQAKLISRIEDAEAGVKKAKDDKVKRVASDEVQKLRARLKDLTKGEDSLEAIKKSLKRRIDEVKSKINRKDYSKPEKIEVELDDEAKKLQEAYRKIKFEFDVAVEKDKLANRTQAEKWGDVALEVFNLPRALMATADLSAPLRQGLLPTLANPVMASKAFVEMLKQWNSKDVADTWLADLKDSPGYQLMQQSGLYIADRTNAKVTAKEEDFQSNFAERIPVAGRLVAKSERAYVAYLNKMRADLFTKGVNVLQNDGMSFASNPQAYKALATYINASTGRGNLGALERAAPILNATFFSPRLMASRVQLLTNWANPAFYKNTPSSVRKMYFKDMGTFIAFGMGVLALASLSGGDVEEDPRSADFGKIRSGNTRWDIWGGFQQFVRYTAQFVSQEKKSTASGKITPLDGSSYSKETRMSVVGNLIRSKLAPVPSAVVDYLYGENMIGDPFNVKNTIISRMSPLVWQGLYESAQQDGWLFAITATGIPSIFGIGVQTYGLNDFLQQGVDDKSIKLLIDKRAVAIEPKENERTVIDAVTGEKRMMDNDEFEKYYASWADYIKNDLKENYEEYSKMSPEKFETEFRKIKSSATSYAKEQVTNVIPETLTLEIDNVTYKLTPDKVAERKEYIQEYIDENEGKRSFERKVEKLIEAGTLKDNESAIRKLLMSEAKRYATQKMKEDYEDNPEELGAIKD
jgi:hypothetical protein